MRVAILVCLTLFLSNCNISEKSEVSNGDGYGEYEISDPSKSHEGSGPVVHIVEIVQMKFVPDVLNVHKGDTVVWVNNDMVMHDVTEQHDKRWTSAPISSRKTWRMVVTQSEDYYCSLHVVMKGKIVVNEVI